MNYSLYLTDNCNLNCKYCYEKDMHANRELSFENIKKIIDNEINSKSKESVITFFGGEPLLKKGLIYDMADYIKSKRTKTKFWFNMTTNGTLIDDTFVDFFEKNNFISLSFSIDGTNLSQDENRIMKNGSKTYDIVVKKAKKLLAKSDSIVAVPVVTKNNVDKISDNLKNLLEIGFKKINFQFDLTADWDDADLEKIKTEFDKISQIYMKSMREEKEFHLLGIDEKIRSYIDDKIDCNDNCSVGMRGVNVGTDGNIYPCMQFMYQPKYVIGNCETGINKERQVAVNRELKQELEECKECSLRRRCNHTCSCINYAFSKNPTQTAPFTCEIERLMISIADNIAEKLFEEKNPIFIQKFYNMYYNNIESQINNKRRK